MNTSKYSADDLQPYKAIPHIRKCWEMFFHVDGIDSPSDLLGRLAQDPRLLGGDEVSAIRFNDWYVVHSSCDWIPDEMCAGSVVANDALTMVTPFSAGTVDSLHYITYVSALATNLISIAGDLKRVEVGAVPKNDSIWTITRPTGTARTVAYTIDERKYWG